MRAKDYLRRVELMNIKIDSKQRQLDELKELATCTGGIGSDGERVQSSRDISDKMADKVARYSDLENEINEDIDRYIDEKQKLIEQIHNLDAGDHTNLYIKILCKRYIEYESLEQIAYELQYSYDRIRHLHGEALDCFRKQYLLNVSTQ